MNLELVRDSLAGIGTVGIVLGTAAGGLVLFFATAKRRQRARVPRHVDTGEPMPSVEPTLGFMSVSMSPGTVRSMVDKTLAFDSPLHVSMFFMHRPVISVCDAAQARQVLSTNEAFPRRMMFSTGGSVLDHEGDAHTRVARVVKQAFSKRNVAHAVDVLTNVVHRTVLPVLDASAGDELAASSEIDVSTSLVRDAIAEAITRFSYDDNSGDPRVDTIVSASQTVSKYSRTGMGMLVLVLPRLRKFFWGETARAMGQAFEEMRVLDNVMDEIRASALSSEQATGFMQALVAANEEVARDEDKLSDEEIKANVRALLFGGNDSSAAAIHASLYYLAMHPE